MFVNKTGPWASPLPLTLQTIQGEFPGGCTITSEDGEVINKAPDRSECVVVGDITIKGRPRWKQRKALPSTTTLLRLDAGREERDEDGASEREPAEDEEAVGLMATNTQLDGRHRDMIIGPIPDCRGYIFSPPWMIFCLWWVTEWLGSLCYNWSARRRKKALSLSLSNHLGTRGKAS